MADGTTIFGDYDVDGDVDILICGSGEDSLHFLIYRNEGSDGFTEIDPDLPKLMHSDVSWNDFDSDGDLDIFLSGATLLSDSLIPEAHIFKFHEGEYLEYQCNISGVYKGNSVWSDFDNDGDQDLILSGAIATTNNGWMVYSSCILYVNDEGSFLENNPGIKGLYNCKIDVSDYDMDTYPDIIMSGELYDDGGFWHRMTRLYRNSGDNTFSVVETGLTDLRAGDVAFGDYDNDGHTDILLTGDPPSPTNLVYVFKNNANGGFYDIGIEIIGTVEGSINWADYDNDGDLDFLLTGLQFPTADEPVTEIYRNAGNGMFSNDHTIDIPGLMHSDISWGDIDLDNDPDLILMGYTDKDKIKPQSLVYINESTDINNPPLPPVILGSEITPEGILLNWGQGYDEETPANGLSYNIRLGSDPEFLDIITPLSLASGQRQIYRQGNAHQTDSALIKGLEEGTYYWSVQSIDHGFIGSHFSEEHSFSVTSTGILTSISAYNYQFHIYPVPAIDKIQLEFYSPDKSYASISLSSITGSLLRESEYFYIKEGENLINLKLDNTYSGIGILTIKIDNKLIFHEKILMAK